MMSAQGGGRGVTKKKMKTDKATRGEGGQANLDVIFLDDINSALPLHNNTTKKIIFDRMDSLLTLNSNHLAVCLIE